MTDKKGVFQVTGITEQNITKGTEEKTDGNTFYEHRNPTGFASNQNSAYLDFNISYITNRGGAGTIVQRQTFSKGIAGLSSKKVNLESSALTVKENEDGSITPKLVHFEVSSQLNEDGNDWINQNGTFDGATQKNKVSWELVGIEEDGTEGAPWTQEEVDINEAPFLTLGAARGVLDGASTAENKRRAYLSADGWTPVGSGGVTQNKKGLDKLLSQSGDFANKKYVALRIKAKVGGPDGLEYSDTVTLQLVPRPEKGNGVVFRLSLIHI